jgi:murein DD-endopeptidase MepM/ murein hydrolase activator NlpD
VSRNAIFGDDHPYRLGKIAALALAVVALTAEPVSALELELPIACLLGSTCFIQQYVDRAPGPDARDYRCGAQTYNGHSGIDIRLRSASDVKQGVAVVAAASGEVVGVRDGMPDRIVRAAQDRSAIAGRECGNGVRIAHGQGWHTQYCHLRQGSVSVAKGERVETGSKLGEVGYSGDAGFPHVHFQVSEEDQAVDPFLPDAKAPCGDETETLWTSSAKAALAYRQGSVLALGFTNRPVGLQALEQDVPSVASRRAPLVAYAWAINLQKGDVVEIELNKDRQNLSRNSVTLDRNKAQFLVFAGKKSPDQGWPEGTYDALVTVVRGGRPLITQRRSIALK